MAGREEEGNVPSDFLNNLANKSSPLGDGSLPAGNTGLGVAECNAAIALFDAVGETFTIPPLGLALIRLIGRA